MLAMKVIGPARSSGTATVFPFRSRTARTRSVPNSSKQPMWPPAKITIGSPASSRMTAVRNEVHVDVSLARGQSYLKLADPSFLTYCTSVKPSSRRSCSATYWGAMTEVAGGPGQPERRCLRRRLRGDQLRFQTQEVPLSRQGSNHPGTPAGSSLERVADSQGAPFPFCLSCHMFPQFIDSSSDVIQCEELSCQEQSLSITKRVSLTAKLLTKYPWLLRVLAPE